ncbi:hypothetical protein [Psychromonas sp. SR45-3]|uniref:hypothetical protein n=1 Tax=Psychromonas sp. SR45-3 TaxID=2760930 RepID=UPI0015FB16D0|nr:hypothetical protein [Psychromonas sp. SR45-3]MBB1274177.1 hypothetical protein [Psychromonas sp. SR45-3]
MDDIRFKLQSTIDEIVKIINQDSMLSVFAWKKEDGFDYLRVTDLKSGFIIFEIIPGREIQFDNNSTRVGSIEIDSGSKKLRHIVIHKQGNDELTIEIPDGLDLQSFIQKEVLMASSQ